MELYVNKDQIRELSKRELGLISGGIGLGTGATGIFSIANIAAAGRLVSGLGYLGGAFSFGYAIGTYGYRTYSRYKYNTP